MSRVLKRRVPLYALFAANGISQTGNMMALVAIPWYVLETTGSAAVTGVVAFFTTVPAVLATFFGGALIDRIGFKAMSVAADLASGLAVVAIPLLHFTVGLETRHLFVLVFLGALLDAPGTTARSALVPDLAEPAGMALERATSIIQAIQRGATLLGAPLAGILVAAFGAANVLWVDAGTFAVSAALVALAVPRAARTAAPAGRYLEELLDGLGFVRQDRLILTLVAFVMVTNFLDTPFFTVILPVFVRATSTEAVDLGLLVGVFGAFSLVGSLLYAAFGGRLPRRPVLAASFILTGTPFWVLSTLPGLPVTMIAVAVKGLAAGPINPILMTVAYERIPVELRGRVLGLATSGAYVAIPAGALAAGFVVEAFGVTTTLVILATVYTLVTVTAAFIPTLAGMERPSLAEVDS